MLRLLIIIALIAATGCSSKSSEVDPKGASLLGEAQKAYARGSYVEALVLADSAARVVPNLPELHYLRGLVLTEFYRFDESGAAFERALDLDPKLRGAHFSLGNNAFLKSTFWLENGYRTAIRHYRAEEALLKRANPQDTGALTAVLLQLGQTYSRMHISDSASAAYQKAIELDTTQATAYAWLAELQQADAQFRDAISNARRAVALESRNPDFETLLGTMLVQQGSFEEAVPFLTDVARIQPWNRAVYHNLGRALVGLGRREEGAAYLARADTMESLRAEIQLAHQRVLQRPDDPIRWENYAILLQRAGRGMEARRAVNVMRYITKTSSQ